MKGALNVDKFIPYEKLSKKRQRELNARQRGSWYGLNPVTRKPKNSKAYDRAKTRNWMDEPQDRVFAFAGLDY